MIQMIPILRIDPSSDDCAQMKLTIIEILNALIKYAKNETPDEKIIKDIKTTIANNIEVINVTFTLPGDQVASLLKVAAYMGNQKIFSFLAGKGSKLLEKESQFYTPFHNNNNLFLDEEMKLLIAQTKYLDDKVETFTLEKLDGEIQDIQELFSPKSLVQPTIQQSSPKPAAQPTVQQSNPKPAVQPTVQQSNSKPVVQPTVTAQRRSTRLSDQQLTRLNSLLANVPPVPQQNGVVSENPAVNTPMQDAKKRTISDVQSSDAVKINKANLHHDLKKLTDMFADYACSDALRFEHCINQTKKEEIIKRHKNLTTVQRDHESQANISSLRASKEPMSEDYIRRVGKHVIGAQSGCCTTFAIAATKIILENAPDDLNVEIFASNQGVGSHVYVVVNRDMGSNIKDPKTWGANCCIVDGWIASLGWETSVYSVEGYRMQDYLNDNVESHYARFNGEASNKKQKLS